MLLPRYCSIEKFKKEGTVGGCGTSGEKRDAYRVLCRNTKERDHLKYLGVGWRKNIEIFLGGIVRGLDWKGLTRERDRKRAVASMVSKLRVS